ncbi:hypothetical protein [Actinoplanes sp. N902-109]|uniref:hypothetical protein n=1 Tax=Actinoplanes sp. (strain N902-109) TaxID=649831 RepID=UPI00032957A8|nr:hypothetical protein [Actinoplanes sp. N902-109]AGL18010.1 cell wall-associated hydrolase [Actinoplanes sp. N902-109]
MSVRRHLLWIVSLALVALPAPAGAVTRSYGGPIDREQVIARAADWLRRDIAYSQDNADARWDRGHGRRYRPDCSGMVSMAWALDPAVPGLGRALVTWELPTVSRRIRWADVRRGDVLLRLVPANRALEHVQLVQAWANPARTRLWVIEQSGTRYDMRRRVVTIAAVRAAYQPYRYRLIR